MPQMAMKHEVDPKKELLASLGDVSGVDVFNNAVLVAIYVRPSRTKSGIYLTDSYTSEDRIQGKAGLVVKQGPRAFVDDRGEWFVDADINEGDWVIFRPSDGWAINVNGVACRLIDDTAIRGKVDQPDRVW
jgi:co-chaperonin GroES (HSP10)